MSLLVRGRDCQDSGQTGIQMVEGGMLELKDITLAGDERPRLDRISLRVDSRWTAIVGCSGAGKTSLLNVIAGFESPESGTVTWSPEHGNQRPRSAAASEAGAGCRLPFYWVPQNGGLWSMLTAEDHVRIVSDWKTADKLLALLGLEARRHARPGELSLGERSRLAVARAVACRAGCLLLDEPLSHVDPVYKPEYWSRLKPLVDEESTRVIFTCHEPETILQLADSVVCLADGRVSFAGTTAELFDSPPDRMTGEFLGPLNWFDTEDARVFLDRVPDRGGLGIRPERLQLVAASTGQLELSAASLRGCCRQSVVTHVATGRSKAVLHLPPARALACGERVALQVVS
jgi:ABC-type multidrug transport system ATPase subunit